MQPKKVKNKNTSLGFLHFLYLGLIITIPFAAYYTGYIMATTAVISGLAAFAVGLLTRISTLSSWLGERDKEIIELKKERTEQDDEVNKLKGKEQFIKQEIDREVGIQLDAQQKRYDSMVHYYQEQVRVAEERASKAEKALNPDKSTKAKPLSTLSEEEALAKLDEILQWPQTTMAMKGLIRCGLAIHQCLTDALITADNKLLTDKLSISDLYTIISGMASNIYFKTNDSSLNTMVEEGIKAAKEKVIKTDLTWSFNKESDYNDKKVVMLRIASAQEKFGSYETACALFDQGKKINQGATVSDKQKALIDFSKTLLSSENLIDDLSKPAVEEAKGAPILTAQNIAKEKDKAAHIAPEASNDDQPKPKVAKR